SNYPAWRLMQALWASDRYNLARFDCLQPHYSLVHREEFERELAEVCRTYGIGVIPYSPLAGGFLTGKYRRGQIPRNSRGYGNDRMRPYLNEQGFAIIDKLTEIGNRHNASPAQTAIAWLLANPTVTSAIVGANSTAQLADTIKAADVPLTPEEKAELDNLPSPT
ncbi:MAG: aldo/keto reductase, partial [Chloroflexi bacterium]